MWYKPETFDNLNISLQPLTKIHGSVKWLMYIFWKKATAFNSSLQKNTTESPFKILRFSKNIQESIVMENEHVVGSDCNLILVRLFFYLVHIMKVHPCIIFVSLFFNIPYLCTSMNVSKGLDSLLCLVRDQWLSSWSHYF